MCRKANYVEIHIPLFSLEISAPLNFELWQYIKYSNEKFVSACPLKPLHGISQNFVGL